MAGTLVKTYAGRVLVERFDAGDRVDPNLPEGWDRTAVPLEGRYVDWRQVDLVLLADTAPCGTATLLRPAAWVEDEGAVIGQTIFLNLPEIGIEGPARVVSIEETIVVPGPGRLVTGVFRHQSGSILELKIEGEHQPLGTTKSHPFWSVDREDWVSAQDLQPGELLLNEQNQPVRLESIAEREEPQEVYNLEIDGDHCYRVGEQGLLVHNASLQCPKQNTISRCNSRTVQSVPWFNGKLEMSSGSEAFVVQSVGRTNLRTPPWWNAFRKTRPYSESSWEQGHVIASRFGGSQGYCNFSAQHRFVNQSVFKVCENRIANALGCGCIKVSVIPHFGTDPVVPERFTIVAVGHGGNQFNLRVTFNNHPGEAVPKECLP